MSSQHELLSRYPRLWGAAYCCKLPYIATKKTRLPESFFFSWLSFRCIGYNFGNPYLSAGHGIFHFKSHCVLTHRTVVAEEQLALPVIEFLRQSSGLMQFPIYIHLHFRPYSLSEEHLRRTPSPPDLCLRK